MHQFVKILVTLVLAVVVLGAAKYLDGNPRSVKVEAPQETAAAVEETTAPVTTEAETEPPTEAPTEAPTETPVEEPEEKGNMRITFVGDCVLGADPVSYYASVGFIKTIGVDYSYPFRNVIDYFSNDELTLLNLEGPLTDMGNPFEKQHVFRGPSSYINILTENSVEAVSLSNNHVQDYGDLGYATTVDLLQDAEIAYVEQDDSEIFTTENGLKVGIYGSIYYKMDNEAIISAITSLKKQGCDLVVFAPHWGSEGAYQPTAEQRTLAYAAIDAGADIVWGTHPHVLQPVEKYKKGMIFYSLGNFSFGGNTNPGDYDTALLQLEVIRDEKGNVSLGELTIVPASISSVDNRNNFQPTPYETGSEEYDRVMKKLNGTWDGANLAID